MVLDEIIYNKRQEVAMLKTRYVARDLPNLLKELPRTRDFKNAFRQGELRLIAELKKASPSAGLLCLDYNPASIAKVYEESGAAALSVLTDEKFFMGKIDDLKAAKDSTTIPVLRKDFIVDESQIYESRLFGADAVLLIARVLSEEEIKHFLQLSEELGMQALVEVHNAREMETALKLPAKIIGINNRDLNSLQISLQNTFHLLEKYPEAKERIIISESGIQKREEVKLLEKAGVGGILVGETLLKSKNIPEKIRELIR